MCRTATQATDDVAGVKSISLADITSTARLLGFFYLLACTAPQRLLGLTAASFFNDVLSSSSFNAAILWYVQRVLFILHVVTLCVRQAFSSLLFFFVDSRLFALSISRCSR